jgi:hypothetical protein
MSTGAIPPFLWLSLGCWLGLAIFVVVFAVHLARLPDERILDYRAAGIENKRRLGIRVFRL